MKKDQVIEIKSEEALEAINNVDGSLIHCFIGFIGTDWNKQDVIDLVKKSKRIAWADNIFAHNLAVIYDGKLHNFDIAYNHDEI